MTMGEPGKNGVRTSDLKECQEILDVFFSHGHKELDTARMYAEGTTEQVRMTVLRQGSPGTYHARAVLVEARYQGRDSGYQVC